MLEHFLPKKKKKEEAVFILPPFEKKQFKLPPQKIIQHSSNQFPNTLQKVEIVYLIVFYIIFFLKKKEKTQPRSEILV